VTETLPQTAEALGAEWALLLECAKPQPDPQRLAELLGASLKWTSLIALAENHSVLGLTAARLANYSEDAISPENRESLRAWRRAYTLFTMNLTVEMFRLFEAFAGSQVEALVIKGPVL
jgi:hypothetical protein